MATNTVRKDTSYSWTEYQTWPEGERWELLGGEPFAMSPTPSSRHQMIALNLAAEFRRHFKGQRCRPFMAPMTVKLSDFDIVEPDLFVVCDPAQIKTSHIEGAPKLIVEILSPSSLLHDRIRKYRLYERYHVAEYWIVNPHPALIEIHRLEAGRYSAHSGFEKHETLASPTFPDWEIALAEIFDFPIEPGEEVVMIREGIPPYPAVAAAAR